MEFSRSFEERDLFLDTLGVRNAAVDRTCLGALLARMKTHTFRAASRIDLINDASLGNRSVRTLGDT